MRCISGRQAGRQAGSEVYVKQRQDAAMDYQQDTRSERFRKVDEGMVESSVAGGLQATEKTCHFTHLQKSRTVGSRHRFA